MESKFVIEQRARIDREARAKGIDIDGMNRELKQGVCLLLRAIRNVKKRKFLWGIFYSGFEGFGRLKPEVEKELERLESTVSTGREK